MYNKKERLLSIFLLTIMFLNILPLDVFASSLKKKSLSEKFIIEGSTLIEYRGKDEDVVIPDGVKEIADNVFKDKELESVKLNEGLEVIGISAFAGNTIKEIILPSSIKEIKDNAFSDNEIVDLDMLKVKDELVIGESAFQDNKIKELSLGKVKLSERSFFANEISKLEFKNNIDVLPREVFANNKLEEVDLRDMTVKLEEDVFASNGQYVVVKSKELESSKSKFLDYGHVVNPVDIVVSLLEPVYDENGEITNKYRKIVSDKVVKFDAVNPGTFFSLNQESFYMPDYLSGYMLDDEKHENGIVKFIPDKNNYELDVFFKRKPKPSFSVNEDKLKELLKFKTEGTNITNEDLLSIIRAEDANGKDISDRIKVSPTELINVQAKEYKVIYSVVDDNGLSNEYTLTLPISINPELIRIAGTEWQLGDFIYEKNKVVGLSEIGQEKSKKLKGLAIPHMNPHTFESINIVDFKNNESLRFVQSGNFVVSEDNEIEAILKDSFRDIVFIGNFPEIKNLEIVGFQAFKSSNFTGKFPKLDNLELLDNNAFLDSLFSGEFPKLDNIKRIGDFSFRNSNFTGEFPKLDKLEVIGRYSFRESNFTGEFPKLDKLEVIGDYSFRASNFTGDFPKLDAVEIIGNYTFRESKFTGDFPKLDLVEIIGDHSFRESKFTGEFPKLDKVKEIRTNAFRESNFIGSFPKMDNLNLIGSSTFRESNFTGEFPNIDSLVVVDSLAFKFSTFEGEFPRLKNVEVISSGSFENSTFSGSLDLPELRELGLIHEERDRNYVSAFDKSVFSSINIPKIEIIGDKSFHNSELQGEIPYIPNVKKIGSYAFNKSMFVGEFPKLDNLSDIKRGAFSQSNFTGELNLPKLEAIGAISTKEGVPEHSSFMYSNFDSINLPSLKYLGDQSFVRSKIKSGLSSIDELNIAGYYVLDTSNLDESEMLTISNDAYINKSSFENIYSSNNYVVNLVTKDKKDAPNVEESRYHRLNPYTLTVRGVNKDGEEILKGVKAIGSTEGDNIVFKIPYLEGYISNYIVSVNRSEIKNDVFTHEYISLNDFKNDSKYYYNMSVKGDNIISGIENYVPFEIDIKALGNTIKKGRIEIIIPDNVEDIAISENQSIKNVENSGGIFRVDLIDDLPGSFEAKIDFRIKFKKGSVSNMKHDIVSMFIPDRDKKVDGNDINEYISNVGYKYVLIEYPNPVYTSLLNLGKNNDTEYLSYSRGKDDFYQYRLKINPKLENLYQNFDDLVVEYNTLKYKDKKGNEVVAKPLSPGWEIVGDKYRYKANGKISEINELILSFDTPKDGNYSYSINSDINAVYKDINGDVKRYKDSSTNTFVLTVEGRGQGSYIKYALTPNKNGRQAYMYDNMQQKREIVKWRSQYKALRDIDTIEITEYKLDERLEYTYVDANGKKVLVEAYDKDDNLVFKENVVDVRQFTDNEISQIKRIVYKYSSINEGEILKPIAGSRLKDPENVKYDKVDPDKNYMYSYFKSRVKYKDENKYFKGEDFAYVELISNDKEIKSVISIDNKKPNLGDANSFVLGFKSKYKLPSQFNKLNYTAIIEKGFALDSIEIINDVDVKYKTRIAADGSTIIDFNLTNIENFELANIENYMFAKINVIPVDFSSKLSVHGIIESIKDEYDVYSLGSDVISGVDTKDKSYDYEVINIPNDFVFIVDKLISKESYVGKRIKTEPGEKFNYKFVIYNKSKEAKKNFKLVDILPFKGDLNNSEFTNKVDLDAINNIEIPKGFKLEFLNQKNNIDIKDRSKIIAMTDDLNWSDKATEDVKAIRLTADYLPDDIELEIDIPMITNTEMSVYDALKETINTFNHTNESLSGFEYSSRTVHQGIDIDLTPKDIKLNKVSLFMGEEDGVVEGVEFKLINLDGVLVDIGKTDKNGDLVFKDVDPGDYILKESKTPEGYKKLEDPIYISLKDMVEASDVLDIGRVENHRVDKFNFVFKNVELVDDLPNIKYDNIKNIYSREIKSGKFKVTNISNNEEYEFFINERFGETIKLGMGKYKLEQIIEPRDNGLSYLKNDIVYMFEVDKFGKLSIGGGVGDNLNSKVDQLSNTIYFPNTIDYKTSTINVVKRSGNNVLLPGAVFELTNIDTGEVLSKTSGSNGSLSFTNVKPGLYSLKEVQAPIGYSKTNKNEIIQVPIDEEKIFNYTFINEKISVVVNKYKVIADVYDKSLAEDIRDKSISTTGGRFIIHETEAGSYQVREVWEDNDIIFNIDGSNKSFKTDKDGSVLYPEGTYAPIGYEDAKYVIENKTKIPGHYEPDYIDIDNNDYIIQEGFDGTIVIDIEVKPLKGTIFASKYIYDQTNRELVKGEGVNGYKYTLMMDRGNGYEKVQELEVINGNYVVFKDLDPLAKYKVVETYVPEGKEPSDVKEVEAILSEDNKFTETVIFRSRIKAPAKLIVEHIELDSEGNIVRVIEKEIDENLFIGDNYTANRLSDTKMEEKNLKFLEDSGNTSGVIFEDEVVVKYYYTKNTGSFTIKKIDGKTGEVVEGAEFTVIDKDGNEIVKTTDKDGLIVIDNLPLDKADYIVKETRAPEGYRLDNQEFTISQEDLENEIELEIKNYRLNEAPETGTLGKLPFMVIGSGILIVAYVFKRKRVL